MRLMRGRPALTPPLKKPTGQEEVEQRPELVEVVLQRCSRDEQAVVCLEQADHLGGA